MVAPAVAASLISAGGSIAGGLLGNKKKKDVYGPMMQQVINEINAIQVPTIEEQKLKLEQLVQQGVITPEERDAILQESSAFEGINLNPEYRQAAEESLAKFREISEAGGLTAIDRSKMQAIQDELEAEALGRKKAVVQDAARRGIQGSGIELGAQLMADQDATNRASRAGTDAAALALQRELDAIKSAGDLGLNLEQSQYNQKADAAKAADIIAASNAAAKERAHAANVDARNAAQVANLQEKQRVNDSNTVMENANRERNSNLIQQNFNNEMDKARAKASVFGGMATNAQKVSDSNTAGNNALWGGITGAITNGAASYFSNKSTPAAPVSNPTTQKFDDEYSWLK